MVSFGICSPELAPNAPFMASAEVLEPRNWGPGGFLLPKEVGIYLVFDKQSLSGFDALLGVIVQPG